MSHVVKWNNLDSGLSRVITDNKKCCCCTPERRIRLENRPEMEFLKAFLVEVSGAFTQVFSDSSFCLVSYPLFSVLQNAIIDYIPQLSIPIVWWNQLDSGLSSLITVITGNKKCCCCTPERRRRLEVNRPEKEFLKVFLIEVSGRSLKSSQTRVFVWFSTVVFCKMVFMNRIIIFFRGFFIWLFKTRVEYGFQ